MYVFLGLIRVDFLNENTGEQVQGWHLWLAEPAELPSAGLRPVKKWFTDQRYEAVFGSLGGAAGVGKYAGREVDVQVGLRGQITGITFPAQK